MLASGYAFAMPLGLSANKKYTSIPEVQGFKYWFGDLDWGKVIYLGVEDLSGFETELHLDFKNKSIVHVTMILGPAGLDDTNCIAEYKKITKLLNKKYGHYRHQNVEKDPLVDDLLAVSICHPVQVGLYKVNTVWKHTKFTIKATLLGDDDGEFFIEIDYKIKPFIDRSTKKLMQAL